MTFEPSQQLVTVTSLPLGTKLVDVDYGPTGLTLKRLLGTGGMATVFLAEYDGTAIETLSSGTPGLVAVKLMHGKTAHMLRRNGFEPKSLVQREVMALTRVMEERPPSDNVVGFYGSGNFELASGPNEQVLPWMALEFVDGGSAGGTLVDRVRNMREGLDPIRVLRIVQQLMSGARALHRHRVIHRDIKPENVFVAGPPDDEIVKLGDCGIARIEGATIPTVPAMSPQYAAPEQYLSALQPNERNPLIGTWTDVHALAALVWYLIAGEDWRSSSSDASWREGSRRRVASGDRVHPGFLRQGDLLAQIDEVLRIGTAHGLSKELWATPAARSFEPLAPAMGFGDTLWSEPVRFGSVEEFEIRLLPLLRSCADIWRELSAAANLAATAVRPTLLLPTNLELQGASRSHEAVRGLSGIMASEGAARIEPGNAIFQPDGRLLARFGRRLAFYADDRLLRVAIPDKYLELLVSTQWISRLPGGGFALVSVGGILLIQDGAVRMLALPTRENAKPVGLIQAVLGDASHFGVVTAETDFRGGPELWLWTNAVWKAPVVLPLSGDAKFITSTPFGYLCVGAHPSGKGRAVLLGFDYQAVSYVPFLTEAPPLNVGVGGTERVFWVAGGGQVIRLERSASELESSGFGGQAVAMGLDPVGSPWLVTTDAVFRRHLGQGKPKWIAYLSREQASAPFVAIGFTPRGAHVLDVDGKKQHLRPPDVREWGNAHLLANRL
jgi:eukaryotic-like serine/threonine-protein kinase